MTVGSSSWSVTVALSFVFRFYKGFLLPPPPPPPPTTTTILESSTAFYSVGSGSFSNSGPVFPDLNAGFLNWSSELDAWLTDWLKLGWRSFLYTMSGPLDRFARPCEWLLRFHISFLEMFLWMFVDPFRFFIRFGAVLGFHNFTLASLFSRWDNWGQFWIWLFVKNDWANVFEHKKDKKKKKNFFSEHEENNTLA